MLATRISVLYQQEYPDEIERYGEAGFAWCVHDIQHILNWAAESAFDYLDLHTEMAWLAGILETRSFPLDRLARSLEISSDTVLDQIDPPTAEPLSTALLGAAEFIRDHGTFLD